MRRRAPNERIEPYRRRVHSPEGEAHRDRLVAWGEAHVERLKRATKDGIVILAGRSLDGIGPAVVIFEVESEEEARCFMEGDPFMKEELRTPVGFTCIGLFPLYEP